MQMYEVAFQSHYANIIDIGKAIVCASSNEEAIKLVCLHFELPPSSTTCQVVRIKPSVFQLERREVDKPREQARARQTSDEAKRTTVKYNCSAAAVVIAGSEDQALRRFASAITERSSADKAIVDKRIQGLILNSEQVRPERRQLRPMETVELYKAKRFV